MWVIHWYLKNLFNNEQCCKHFSLFDEPDPIEKTDLALQIKQHNCKKCVTVKETTSSLRILPWLILVCLCDHGDDQLSANVIKQ